MIGFNVNWSFVEDTLEYLQVLFKSFFVIDNFIVKINVKLKFFTLSSFQA